MNDNPIKNDFDSVNVKTLANKKTHLKKVRVWYFEVFLFSLLLCGFFGVISEIMLSHTNIMLAVLLILLLVCVSMIFDMIGVAVTASDIKPFLLKASTNQKEINIAISLIKNADRVNSICADVVGDVCSILSGAGGATICMILLSHDIGISSFVLSIALSSLIASINVLGKAIGKTYAMSNAQKLVLKVAKLIGIFVKSKTK